MQAFLVDLENKPGELARVAEALGEKGINITGVSGSTCGSSGRLAMTTADEARTRSLLGEIGCRFEEMEVAEASMRHEPGTLGMAARRLADAGINIEAMFATGMTDSGVSVAFVTSDAARAREVLSGSMSGSR
jgi:hypothetical protein